MSILDEAGNPLLDEAGNPLEVEAGSGLSLLSHTSGSAAAPVGPQSLSPENDEGNLLLAVGAWSTGPAGSEAPVPASSVADSAGNWWQLLGDSGSTCPGVRCAVWACTNPLAIPGTGWWSFALQGYAASAAWTVAEMGGAGTAYTPVVDFSAPFSTGPSGTGTAFSLSQTAGQADYTILAAAAQGTAVPVLTGGSWTTITSTTVPAGGGTLSTVCAFGAATAGSAVTGGGTVPSAVPLCGVMVGISQASYPPAQSNPQYPAVRVEAAFGSDPGDPSYAILDASWTDLTSRALSAQGVAGITASRGKQYELAEPEAGELAVLLSNVDGAFDPQSPASPFYSDALNANMSFQLGTGDWRPNNGATLAWSTAASFASSPAAAASHSLQVTCGTAASPGAQSEMIPVDVNLSYTSSAWFSVPGGWGSGAKANINWYTAAKTFISTSISTGTATPDGTWVQDTLTATPPSNAAFMEIIPGLAGTPGTAVTFYIAEAAIAAGTAPVQTGLVRLGTPVRVSAYWEGRRYPVGSGQVERWPQTWPQQGLPQWGFSPMIATDTAGAAAIATLPSAVQGEILADTPYACFPFSEQYTETSSSLNGPQAAAVNASGLTAVNTSRVNQQAAVYISGDAAVETGGSLAFQGDSGTGMGVSGYGTLTTTGKRGSGAVYGPDPGLPSIGQAAGCAFEFWVTVPSGMGSVPSAGALLQYLQLFGAPYIGSISPADLAPGWVASVGVRLPASGSPTVFNQQSTSSSLGTAGAVTLDGLHHIAVQVAADGSYNLYLDGTFIGASLAALLNGPLRAVTFGQASYAYGSQWPRWNYQMAYGTVYQWRVPQARVQSHYTAGATGFAGDTFAVRAGRYLAWSYAALAPAGPGSVPDAFGLAAAYDTDGTSLASALNADAQSCGGMWYANAAGNLVIVPRPALYNLPASLALGDNPAAGEVPYLGDLGFDYDNTYLQNITQATLTQGPDTLIAPVAKDLGSIGQYGARGPLSLSISGTSPEDAYDAATWNLAKYAQPSMRAGQVTVDAASHPDAFGAVLAADIATVATVTRRPVGAPPYSLPVITERVEHSIGPGLWTTAYQLSPYQAERTVLSADSGTSGTLGSTTLAW